MSETQSNKGLIIGIVAVTILIFGGLAWVVLGAPSNVQDAGGTVDQVSFSDEKDPYQGPADSKVVVHIYGDFQCPACRAAEAGLKSALEKYREMGVKFVWKDFPLSFHRNARAAANAARCGFAQGWFWRMHDLLFQKQSEWAELSDPSQKFVEYFNELKTIAPEGRFNPTLFQSCLGSLSEDANVKTDIDEGNRNRVDRTPTFFINNRRFYGMSPAEWETALQHALAEAKNASATSSAATPSNP